MQQRLLRQRVVVEVVAVVAVEQRLQRQAHPQMQQLLLRQRVDVVDVMPAPQQRPRLQQRLFPQQAPANAADSNRRPLMTHRLVKVLPVWAD
jgi:hypothetical protein